MRGRQLLDQLRLLDEKTLELPVWFNDSEGQTEQVLSMEVNDDSIDLSYENPVVQLTGLELQSPKLDWDSEVLNLRVGTTMARCRCGSDSFRRAVAGRVYQCTVCTLVYEGAT